jgi:hypothetical protein
MVGSRLNDSLDSEQGVGDGIETPVADYLETIALLQEEIARLEQELRWYDERQIETTSNAGVSSQDETEAASALENVAGDPEEVERSKAELASRDETIRLLLDELSRVEEAQAATQAEWEHLAGWVAELERRVEGQDGDALQQLENRIVVQQQKAESLQVKSELDRRAWETQRQFYQSEITRLQEALDQVATAPEAAKTHDGQVTEAPGLDSTGVEALQAENVRLRAAWQELVERTAAAARSESLEVELAEALNERNQFRRQLEQIQDDMKRERLESEATVAELQARLSQASLAHPQGPPPEQRSEGISSALDIDLRVRALRQHLLEVDQREKEEKRQKHLINRLSRLWSRTGPR